MLNHSLAPKRKVSPTMLSFCKALSWKLVSTGLAIVIAYLLTGSVSIALSIAIIHIPLSIGIFMIHDWAWNKLTR